MNVLVTGGAGYVGSRLVPALLGEGHNVIIYDCMFFGEYHIDRDNPHLKMIRGDIRDTDRFESVCQVSDAVIHLACISNDPSSELDKDLTKEINYTCFEPLVIAAKRAGIKRFINCSSSSVYGISDAPDVTEEHPLVPVTLYNTFKAMCEPLLFKHQSDDFVCVNIRPSTICGYSPRQRLDLAVNILTNLAVNKGIITVYGGEQKRPNLHIEDMVRCYLTLLDAPAEKIWSQTFNVGAENKTIDELAIMVQRIVRVPIEHTSSVDVRSYQVNSDKIKNVLGFIPQHTITQAIRALVFAFEDGMIPDPLTNDKYYNVRQMRKVIPNVYKDAPPSKFDPTIGHLSEIDLLRSTA